MNFSRRTGSKDPVVFVGITRSYSFSGTTPIDITEVRDLALAQAHPYIEPTGVGGTATYPSDPGSTVVGFSSTITPNVNQTSVLSIGPLTANITIANPIGSPIDGQRLRLRMEQDGVGGWTTTFGSAFSFGSDVTTALIPTTASAKYEMIFAWHTASSKWRCLAIARGF